MAMTLAPRSGVRAEINVTPMIDLLLVLLIVFMAIAPQQSKGLDALVPQQASRASEEPAAPIVLDIDAAGEYWLNSHAVTARGLLDALQAAASRRAEPVLFLQADGQLEFSVVAAALDIAGKAGFGRTALMHRPGDR